MIGAGFVGTTVYDYLSDSADIRLVSKHSQKATDLCDYGKSVSADLISFMRQSKFVIISQGSGDMDWVETFEKEAEKSHVDDLRNFLSALPEIEGRIVYLSSDNVFTGGSTAEGTVRKCYVSETPDPSTVYGRLKVTAEKIVMERRDTCVMRIPLLISMTESMRNPLYKIAGELRQQTDSVIHADSSQVRYPTYVEDIIDYLMGFKPGEKLIHFSSDKAYTRYDLYCMMNRYLGTGRTILGDGVYPVDKPGLKTALRTQVQLVNNVDFVFRHPGETGADGFSHFGG